MSIRPIDRVAADFASSPEDFVPFGDGVAKLRTERAFASAPQKGSLVLVSAINPTPAGEGKTTVTIGLSDALRRRGVVALAALRQPSLGPTLGSKGGGAGGGRAHLEPFDRVNLGLSGDIHAVTSAHNLLASMIDNALHFRQSALDARKVDFQRVIDLDDRSLRYVLSGLGGVPHGVPREGRFDITAASEVMAILCLSRDYADLKKRLARILVGSAAGPENTPIFAQEMGAVGGMAVVLRDALRPNLVQTAEGTPALVHGGPFGNIAHGCSSIVATRYALTRAEVVVSEAGFGFDLGGEKFLDIKCRLAGIWPKAMVMVATLRALKMHGGATLANAALPDRKALDSGASNLAHHIATAARFGLKPIVALNVREGDPEDEIDALRSFCASHGCQMARTNVYIGGGEGGLELADMVKSALASASATPTPKYLYELNEPLRTKIEKVAKASYGATGVDFSSQAEADLKRAEAIGLGEAPVCMAKTHLSLSADPKGGGRPRDFVLPVRSVRLSAGAGFIVPLCGEIMTMPGLGKQPAVLGMDLGDDGEVKGLK